jgi:hypothetical protein
LAAVLFGELTDLAIGDGNKIYILDKVNKAVRVVEY